MKTMLKKCLSFLMALSVLMTVVDPLGLVSVGSADATGIKTETYLERSTLLDNLMKDSTSFIVMKAKQRGGSHYAYTEAIAEEMNDSYYAEGTETNFRSGSQMVLVSLEYAGNQVKETQEVLIDCPDGVVRDPDVSTDGKRVLFSWKKTGTDDYHLYEMTLADRSIRQLTFGSGIADFEPQYTSNGNIIFSSSRCIQTVDCWKTPVSNLYMCGSNGENIVRLTYDQVHDTFATTTSDGRVIYTRWDYNDRTQMWVQGVFQMNPDGTNQTELFGNNANFPTTLLHTREVPGVSDLYISIGSGHHVNQAGELMLVDLSKGRNDPDAVTIVFPDEYSNKNSSVDGYGQKGTLFKYPYAISQSEFLVSYSKDGWTNGVDTPFDICLMNTAGEQIVLVEGTTSLPAAQIVPIKTRTMFDRASMVNYGTDTGTYYVADVYEGDSMAGVERGTVKQLRVVEIEYRSYAIGATVASGSGSSDPYTPIATGNGSWDIKRVLGVVDVEADGSAMFKVPALVPVYFQLLDKDGSVVQTMRSWSTLMPNESYSCVGCHEDKNTVPKADGKITDAMKKGVQELKPDVWQEDYNCYEDEAEGFDYLTEIQSIFDKSCVECHSDPTQTTFAEEVGSTVFDERSQWKYTTTAPASTWTQTSFNDSSWKTDYAPFGTANTNPGEPNTRWDSDSIWMRKTFKFNHYQLSVADLELYLAYAGNTEVYINGTKVWQGIGSVGSYTTVPFTDQMKAACTVGDNVICVKTDKGSAGNFADVAIKAKTALEVETPTLIAKGSTWSYLKNTSDNAPSGWNTLSFDDSSWQTAKAPFGDRLGGSTSWTGDDNYIWLRQSFTIEDLASCANAILKMNIYYDDNPEIYINGVLVYDPDNWVDDYTTVTLSEEAVLALREGENVLAIKCMNTGGGRCIDTSLTMQTMSREEVEEAKGQVLIEQRDTWTYRQSNNDDAPAGWNTVSFDDSSWRTANAPFGDRLSGSTGWGDTFIWIRHKFTINNLADVENALLEMDIYYDDNPLIYINGVLVYDPVDWVDEYTTIKLPMKATEALVQGENVLAIRCRNTTGGRCIDTSLSIKKAGASGGHAMFSLESTNVDGKRTKKYFPLSYLVLTDSFRGDVNIVGRATNRYITWISTMSQPEILKPYSAGSARSNLITKLREGHGNLTDAEVRTICAWIDLAVPCYGNYDADGNNFWTTNDYREAVEETNKRDYYDMLDEYARKARANGGTLSGKPLTVQYASGSTVYSLTGNDMVALPVPRKYNVGDKVSVTLPEGEKYVCVTLASKMGESLLYVPDGVYTYEITSEIAANSSYVMNASNKMSYINNTVAVRLPTDEELKETRNLALNAYDRAAATGSYPHATSNDVHNGQAEFAARNIIDGFIGNTGHGTFPNQSWGPSQNNPSAYLSVDFGREVNVSELHVYIRADFPHDTYYTDATLEFSDGSTREISLRKTEAVQIIDLNGKVTSGVTLKNLNKGGSEWAALMEVEVYGSELQENVDDRGENPTIQEEKPYAVYSTTDNTVWTGNGTAVSLSDYLGVPDQSFRFVKAGEGYIIRNKDDLCLTVNGETVTLSAYNASAETQVWTATRETDGYIFTLDGKTLVNRNGNLQLATSPAVTDGILWRLTTYQNLTSTTLTNLVTDRATATADSVNQGWNDGTSTADKTVDRDNETRWQSNRTGENADNAAWLAIDLGKVTVFNRVVLYWETARAATDGYIVEVSEDGVHWTAVTAPVVSRGDNNVDTVDFKAVSAQHIRFYITKMADSKYYYPSIWEVEVYDTNEPLGGSEIDGMPNYSNLIFDDATGFVTGFAEGDMTGTYSELVFTDDHAAVPADGVIKTGLTVTYGGKSYTTVLKGDVNCDGAVTAADMTVAARYLGHIENGLSNAARQALNVNGDREETASDLTALARHIGGVESLF